MDFKCDVCQKTYSSTRSRNRHLREYHKAPSNTNEGTNENNKIFRCLEGCEVSFRFNLELRRHLQFVHRIDINEEEHLFSNIEEFNMWLAKIEEDNGYRYSKPNGKKRSNENNWLQYFYCSRSGAARQINNERKRNLKIQGSIKIGLGCTSYIKLTVSENGKCKVNYSLFHYGHCIELKHIPLSNSARTEVARKLASGITPTRILDQNRDNISEKFKRTDLLVRKDINNIKTSFNIELNDGVRHKNDAMSLDLFVKQCQQEENNAVLFYKPQGISDTKIEKDDFCLILMNYSQQKMLERFGNNIIAIDSTHGLNGYDFELTTLMVVDNCGEGFPGACMLTNRKDSSIFRLFFECIKFKTGTLCPNTFISDVTDVFYVPWQQVMGSVPNRLYCSWHIDRAWQKNLNKIGTSDKQATIYKTLKVLQQTLDVEEFHILLSKFLEHCQEDPELTNFGSYFQKYYASNFITWAYCYRKALGINTNMKLESMHKIIKYFYLDGKKTKRLDKGVHALNRFIRDKILDRVIKNVKGKANRYIRDIINRHKTAVSECLDISLVNSHKWIVLSKENKYIVSRNSSKKCCAIACVFCNICIHSFNCTCVDFCIHNTICKHIHCVCIKMEHSHNENYCKEKETVAGVEVCDHLHTLSQNKSNSIVKVNCSKEILINKIKSQTVTLNIECEKVKDISVLSHVLKNVTNQCLLASSYIEKNQNLKASVSPQQITDFKQPKHSEPANKKIEQQLRFFSTKKPTKKKANSKSKPDSNEISLIKKELLGNELFVSNSSRNDHNYCFIVNN